ncbi:hypothetical protein JCM24511_08652 [Saitozyma sp. JCM 24511]|nr:hypothetical protein JCM24511_08652 [Saitozyma sp. JCM 24511]
MSSSTMLPGFSKLEINDIMHLPRDYDLGGLVSNRYGNGNRDRNGYHRGIGSTGTPDRASPKGLGAATPTRSRNGDVYWNGYKLRKSPEEDVSRYQFWPNAMAMGSFIGKTFIQMLGGACEYGEDLSRVDRNGMSEGYGKSYLAFDFVRELLVIRGRLRLGGSLPPALRPIDAELSFDDIASNGIRIETVPRIFRRSGRETRGQEVTVTVGTRRPPKFFTVFEEFEKLMGASKSKRMPYRRRATAMDFANAGGAGERDVGPINAIPEGPCAYPTFWNTWRWVFDLTDAEHGKLRACIRRFQTLAETEPNMDLLVRGEPRWDIRKLDADNYAKLYGLPDLSAVRFSTRTLIEGLIAHGKLRPGDVTLLLHALRENAVVQAFQDRILESLYSEERIRNVSAIVRGKARFLRHVPPKCLDHLVMIRTVLVTPTRILIGPPQQEPSNSVTRRYSDKLDGIIRVQFADEEDALFVADYTKQADSLRPDVGPMARVRRALQHGIVIGGQRFLPVASSASQQKERAIWFINPKLIDGLELRKWMGSVEEKIVAKHAARMGLPFSTSRIVHLDVHMGPVMADVERNGFTFTDGVGIAGSAVMTEAARALGATYGINSTPSAIQFRLGGAKGVLACWPNMVGEHEIRLRKSNIKFESNLTDLNVVRLAKHQTAFLNRQFIMIMCANGVPGQVVLDLFKDAITHIKGLRDRVRRKEVTKEDYKLIGQCSEFPLSALIKAGFHDNPMVLDICSIIETRALQDLKWRARVQMPGGVFLIACLIGISDESGTLKEGEVFCQFQERDDEPPKFVTAEVISGDVRRAWAVDRPELRHLKNVIVFSTQGKRDLPNMLGGGDLDGDDYTLIWDPRFVKSLTVYGAMNYTAPPPITKAHVTQADLNEASGRADGDVIELTIAQNFVQYILNDVLGQVDNTHLALSDIGSPFDEDCLHLSEVHSVVSGRRKKVADVTTAGQAAVLDPKIKPKFWPDFMDRVQPDPHFRPSDIKDVDYPVDERLSEFPIYKSLLKRLEPIKAQFEHAMQYDMRRYKVYECEIPSGIALRNKRRKRARDQNLNEPLRDSYNSHVAAARAAAFEAIQHISFKSRLTPAQVVARHCYALTYEKEHVERWEEQQRHGEWGGGGGDKTEEEKVNGANELRRAPMVSFAWCFWQELVELANMALL